MTVEVDVLGSPSMIVLMGSVDAKQYGTEPDMLEFMSCVKVEVDGMGFPSLIVPMVSVDVKQH